MWVLPGNLGRSVCEVGSLQDRAWCGIGCVLGRAVRGVEVSVAEQCVDHEASRFITVRSRKYSE